MKKVLARNREHIDIRDDRYLVGVLRRNPVADPQTLQVHGDSRDRLVLENNTVCRIDRDIMVLVNVHEERCDVKLQFPNL